MSIYFSPTYFFSKACSECISVLFYSYLQLFSHDTSRRIQVLGTKETNTVLVAVYFPLVWKFCFKKTVFITCLIFFLRIYFIQVGYRPCSFINHYTSKLVACVNLNQVCQMQLLPSIRLCVVMRFLGTCIHLFSLCDCFLVQKCIEPTLTCEKMMPSFTICCK